MDYNIYIHGDGSTLTEKTVPFDMRSDGGTSAVSGNGTINPFTPNNVQKAYSVATGQTGLGDMALQQGVSQLKKAIPIAGMIIAAVEVAEKVVATGFQHSEDYTGNYQYNLNYNNIKTYVKNVLNPIGAIKNTLTLQKQMEKDNIQIQQRQKLIGSSTLRNLDRGV